MPSVLPSAAKSFGLWSNVSMCDTPPLEKIKMTRLAFAGKCGVFGDSGSGAASSARRFETNPGKSSDEPTSERMTSRRRNKRGEVFIGNPFKLQAGQIRRVKVDREVFGRLEHRDAPGHRPFQNQTDRRNRPRPFRDKRSPTHDVRVISRGLPARCRAEV